MIKIYSTPTCPFCEMAKEFFTDLNLKYEDFDVSENIPAQEEMIKVSGQMGVPVIDIDGEVITGFDRSAVEEILKKKNLIK